MRQKIFDGFLFVWFVLFATILFESGYYSVAQAGLESTYAFQNSQTSHYLITDSIMLELQV